MNITGAPHRSQLPRYARRRRANRKQFNYKLKRAMPPELFNFIRRALQMFGPPAITRYTPGMNPPRRYRRRRQTRLNRQRANNHRRLLRHLERDGRNYQ